MTLAELRAELYDRGSEYLEDAAQDARANRWLNQAYLEIANSQPWPFLRTTATGAPDDGFVSVPNLRKVLFVTDATGVDTDTQVGGPGQPLERISIEDLVNGGYDLTATGSPSLYYIINDGVYGWPDGGLIRVSYLRRPSLLTDSDSPVFAEQYQDLIIDRAMIKVYKDSDNFDAVRSLREEYNQGLAAMAADYLPQSRDVQLLI